MKHTSRLGESPLLVWEEHDGELANNHVKGLIRIRQLHGIGLAPLDGTSGACRSSLIEHRLVSLE